MAFTPNPNTGTLWPHDKKSPNQPDMRGDIHMDRSLLLKLMKSDGDLVKISISGWRKSIAGKDCLSLAASEPYVRQEPKVSDEDIPF